MFRNPKSLFIWTEEDGVFTQELLFKPHQSNVTEQHNVCVWLKWVGGGNRQTAVTDSSDQFSKQA